MGKSLYIAEKPSVAREFAKALSVNGKNCDGYIEGNDAIVTWCVGHLVCMSYPEVYDESLKKWRMDTLPFLPSEYKYEVISSAAKQYAIVSSLLKREDVDTIYVATDSGREGEYIYRLVEQMSGVSGKNRRRVWIDSQTEEEIKRGVREAKDLSEYDDLACSAYLRAKEDYLMGINFSRVLSLKYGRGIADFLHEKYAVVRVGRVMTCVLGMVVNREREIRNFVKTSFYRVTALAGDGADAVFKCEWKAAEGSKYYGSPALYKENRFKKEEDAKALIRLVQEASSAKPLIKAKVESVEKKKENKNAPLLYNLAELQNDCSKLFKITPDETLNVIQELYEKKLVTYPRTDARVLSTAVAKEIHKNLTGLKAYPVCGDIAAKVLESGSYKGIEKTKYTDDSKITDHYAVIPTGAGLSALSSLSPLQTKVYEIIVRRFLAIFFGPAQFQKLSIAMETESGERFFAGFKVMFNEGYRAVTTYSFAKQKAESEEKKDEEAEEEQGVSPALLEYLKKLKKGSDILIKDPGIKEGETSPPKRYTGGSMILAMENAGKLIENEDLREQIKGSGIGTSATRAEIIKKLVDTKYLKLNKKTQVITPSQMGEMIYEVVKNSIPRMLDPEFTASWEKGLTMVACGTVKEAEYMEKLNGYVSRNTNNVKQLGNANAMGALYRQVASYYK